MSRITGHNDSMTGVGMELRAVGERAVLVGHDGVTTTLPRLLAERATALQVMFTACTTTCPIQGAIFARVQKLIPDQVAHGIQLVSLSVDPAHDTSAALARWLRQQPGIHILRLQTHLFAIPSCRSRSA